MVMCVRAPAGNEEIAHEVSEHQCICGDFSTASLLSYWFSGPGNPVPQPAFSFSHSSLLRTIFVELQRVLRVFRVRASDLSGSTDRHLAYF